MRKSQEEGQHRPEDSDSAEVARYHEASRNMENASYTNNGNDVDWENATSEEESVISYESHMFDVDRMVNEGLGGGNITADNGFISDSTTDSMVPEVRDDEDV
ncbi:hypothetical protein [Paenibacillus sp.]|jgi:hypothetical protein|uniref:hypothetical protein n=1 Tax=Paenibacillus sp. TaxID=58172 RepID=UPI002826178A|nr:hypothetical protein [Paenibacillus sp.]MDR0268317.1 hypothetical protein [Paenibacillus sp.]